MSQYILLNRINIQDANAIAGLTWGFPAITGFLGFVHALSLKLKDSTFSRVCLDEKVMIVSHTFEHQTYIDDYQITRFSQRRGANFYSDTDSDKKSKTMTRIEEGRMDLTISLLIPVSGRVSANKKDSFIDFVERTVSLMRVVGGSVLEIDSIDLLALDENNPQNKILLKRKLTPGFILQNLPDVLQKHFEFTKKGNPNTDLVDAWLDFSALKYKARPAINLIDKYLLSIGKANYADKASDLLEIWQQHLELPYEESLVPIELQEHFSQVNTNNHSELQVQWQEYCHPSEKTKANWEYLAKPDEGYLIPLMTGYTKISDSSNHIKNLRGIQEKDFENAYFVEAVYSIGKWIFSNQIDFNKFPQYFWGAEFSEQKASYLCVSNTTD